MQEAALTWGDYETLLTDRYIQAGMSGAAAIYFAKGEINAIINGRHWTHGKPTPNDPTAAIVHAIAEYDLTLTEKNAYNELSAKYEFNARMTRIGAESKALAEVLDCRYKQSKKIDTAVETKSAEIQPPIQASPGLVGLELLLHFAGHGCGIKDFWETGEEIPENFTTDKEKISAMWKAGKSQYKVFLRGFLVIDIDRNHKGGADGLDRFYEIYDKKRLPSTLQNIAAFPCLVETPSGGVHLYFRYNGSPLIGKHDIDPAIEIKTRTITAPIIHRNGKPYKWHGTLDAAPRLYPIIRGKIPGIEPEQQKAAADRPSASYGKSKYIREGGTSLNPFNDSLQSIYGHVCNRYSSPGNGNRNQFCYQFGIAAGKKGFSEIEILNYLESTPAKTDDMKKTVQSALKSKAVQSAGRV